MNAQWVVLVGDADGNTGEEEVVGPFRTEEKACDMRDRIERHLSKAGISPLADVYPLRDWSEVVDEFLEGRQIASR